MGLVPPSTDEHKSWANELISGAQLVSTRVLRHICQLHVTLNRKCQGLWPCAARRITKGLETGEVLADEDVTKMTNDELHRTLDKPRKLRVDFYAHTEGDGADQSEEEECDPRNLLDPVDEHRSLMETLMSLGVDQGTATKKVSELYSPPRVTREAQRRPALGISGLRAFDLSTAHPEGGNWNQILKEHRDLATRICEDDDPDWLIGPPPCTDFSVLGQWRHKRMKIEGVRRRLREARRRLEFCVVLYNKQLARGKRAGGRGSWSDSRTGTESTQR